MSYPFIGAHWFTPGPRTGPINKIVLHTIECPCAPGWAKKAADIFAKPTATKVSAHYYVSSNEIIQGVKDTDIAWAAPGANADGIQIEQAGRAIFSDAEWSTPDATAMLKNTAILLADLSSRYNIPLRFCSAADMLADVNAKGVTTHAEVNKAFHRSDHTDPGKKYPLDYVLIEARALLTVGSAEVPTPPSQEDDDMPTLTIRDSQTGEINTYSGGARRKFKLAPGADPATVQHNLDLIQDMRDKGLLASAPPIDLDHHTFNAIPELTTS